MPLYETVLIARNDLTQQQVDTITDQISAIITDAGGEVKKREYWGLRGLAYRIKKNRKGHYMLLGLECPPAAEQEMARQLGLNEDVLRHMTGHVDSGEPLPRALFDKMLKAKNFQSGLATLRQVEFSLFDMLLHSQHDPADDFMPLLDSIRKEVAVLQSPAFSRSAHTFSHIFAGGYAAGYYSYKWAEVLSADAYAAFEESAGADGLPSAETGKRYREEILESGGSRPAMESFKAFRGRAPTLDALLRHQGMSAQNDTVAAAA